MRRPRVDPEELNRIRSRIPRVSAGPPRPQVVEVEADVLERLAADAHEYARTRRLNLKLHRRVQHAEALVSKVRKGVVSDAVRWVMRVEQLVRVFDTLADYALEDTQEHEAVMFSLQEVALIIRDILVGVPRWQSPILLLESHGAPKRILERVVGYHRDKCL